ncbi:hypothetical protein AB0L82_37765 [Nocardia sp. NPDC052001]|uniref:hypothetical protein n=1 Tax=Nocardia sp. NPDC052001 TaxID=3154853 RepID=UPI0034139891
MSLEAGPVSSSVSQLEFADALLRAAIRPERIGAVVTRIMQENNDIGPIVIGPGGLLRADARMRGETATVEPDESDLCQFDVHVPLVLWLDIHLGELHARLLARVHVRTHVTLIPDVPCALVIQLHPIRTCDVTVSTEGRNMLGRIITRFGMVTSLLAGQIATHANSLLSSPDLIEAFRIDILGLIDRAWDAGFVFGKSL